MDNQIITIVVCSGIFYMVLCWLEKDAKKIIYAQRNLINDLLAENHSLNARLELLKTDKG